MLRLHEQVAILRFQVAESEKPGRFRDNDGLAALLAVELKADLLMLCTDVNGLYTGNPREPCSELIPTYCPQASFCWPLVHYLMLFRWLTFC